MFPIEKSEVYFPQHLLKHAFEGKEIEYKFGKDSELSVGKLTVTTLANYKSYVRIDIIKNRRIGAPQIAQICLTQSMLDVVHPHLNKSDAFLAIFE